MLKESTLQLIGNIAFIVLGLQGMIFVTFHFIFIPLLIINLVVVLFLVFEIVYSWFNYKLVVNDDGFSMGKDRISYKEVSSITLKKNILTTNDEPKSPIRGQDVELVVVVNLINGKLFEFELKYSLSESPIYYLIEDQGMLTKQKLVKIVNYLTEEKISVNIKKLLSGEVVKIKDIPILSNDSIGEGPYGESNIHLL